MQTCKFVLDKRTPRHVIRKRIAKAIYLTESVYGKSKVRLNVSYWVAGNKVVFDVTNRVGQHVAEVFTSLTSWEAGEAAFTTERIKSNG